MFEGSSAWTWIVRTSRFFRLYAPIHVTSGGTPVDVDDGDLRISMARALRTHGREACDEIFSRGINDCSRRQKIWRRRETPRVHISSPFKSFRVAVDSDSRYSIGRKSCFYRVGPVKFWFGWNHFIPYRIGHSITRLEFRVEFKISNGILSSVKFHRRIRLPATPTKWAQLL